MSDAALFLLLATLHAPKADRLRVFHERSLYRPSIVRRLHDRGLEASGILAELVRGGLVERVGHRAFRATLQGNVVKHVFANVRAELAVQLGVGRQRNTIEFVREVRNEVARRARPEPERR